MLQCINEMPVGPVKIPNNKITPPSKTTMKNSMEALIHHLNFLQKVMMSQVVKVVLL